MHGVVRIDRAEGEGVYSIEAWVDINKVYFLTFDLSDLEKNKEIEKSELALRIFYLARTFEKAKRIGLRVIYKTKKELDELSAHHKYEELVVINGTDYITGLRVNCITRREDNVEPPSVILPSEENLDDVVILFNKLNDDFKLGFQEMYKIIKKVEGHITVFELHFCR
nr:hypothetical protein [Candidatus Freyarchaeota archaeon]